MSSLGSPTQRTRSTDELLRTVLNAILEEKIKNQGLKTQTPVTTISAYETVELSDANPTITSTAAGGYTYEDAVGIWRFNTGSTLTVVDESGFGNHGTATGMTWVAGKYGYGGSLDGTDDYVEISDSNSLDLTTNGTIMGWIKTTQSTSAQFISKYDANVGGNGYALGINFGGGSSGILTFYNGAVFTHASTTVNDDNWHHIAATFSSGTLQIWRDAVIDKTATGLANLIGNAFVLRFGANPVTGGFASGTIDGFRIYAKTLTTTEITRAFNNMFSYYDRSDYA